MILSLSFISLDVCTTEGTVHANIVVAGDPKQLDAVTKSKWAVKLTFKTSFLEHLCERKLYQRNPETGKFNQNYITQLVKNYRSHPAILKISNSLFYDDKLEAKGSNGISFFLATAIPRTL